MGQNGYAMCMFTNLFNFSWMDKVGCKYPFLLYTVHLYAITSDIDELIHNHQLE
jgi:hypothetical protein